jgi:hypothetical protein
MNKEMRKLIRYCEDNGIKVVFTDSTILHDYAAQNPEAARVMGFPDIDNNPETKEILIDKTQPKETQIANLKHELIEMMLMRNGMAYWSAHLIALKMEKEPFDFSQPMCREMNMVRVGNYDNRSQQSFDVIKKPRGWRRWFSRPKKGIVKGR